MGNTLPKAGNPISLSDVNEILDRGANDEISMSDSKITTMARIRDGKNIKMSLLQGQRAPASTWYLRISGAPNTSQGVQGSAFFIANHGGGNITYTPRKPWKVFDRGGILIQSVTTERGTVLPAPLAGDTTFPVTDSNARMLTDYPGTININGSNIGGVGRLGVGATTGQPGLVYVIDDGSWSVTIKTINFTINIDDGTARTDDRFQKIVESMSLNFKATGQTMIFSVGTKYRCNFNQWLDLDGTGTRRGISKSGLQTPDGVGPETIVATWDGTNSEHSTTYAGVSSGKARPGGQIWVQMNFQYQLQ